MKVRRIHHVTMAVQDIDAARAELAALLGGDAGPIDTVAPFGVRSSEIRFDDGALELVAPMDHDNPVMRYIERRGEGFYTLALEVDDLDAAVTELAGRGVRVSEPVEASAGIRTAFVTMAATHGLSIQLLEATFGENEIVRPAAAPDERASWPLVDGRSAAPDAAERSAWAPPAAAQPEPSPEEPATTPPPPARAPLDLTPDEWSDVD